MTNTAELAEGSEHVMETLTAADGTEIRYRTWRPDGDPRAVALVAHGMSEHSGRYARLAEALTDRGLAVYAPDHRGHGETAQSTGVGKAGAPGPAGIVDDLDLLVDRALDDVGELPVVLIGHSMGALLAQAYAERYGDRLAALALSGSGGAAEGLDAMAAAMAPMAEGEMADQPVPMLPLFNEAFEPGRTAFDWLSRDEAEVDAYLADPFCGDNAPSTWGFTAGVVALIAEVMKPGAISAIPAGVPVLLLTGERDPASSMAENVHALEGRMRDAGLEVEAHYYPDARHEIFNETNRDEVTADLLAWIDRALAP